MWGDTALLQCKSWVCMLDSKICTKLYSSANLFFVFVQNIYTILVGCNLKHDTKESREQRMNCNLRDRSDIFPSISHNFPKQLFSHSDNSSRFHANCIKPITKVDIQMHYANHAALAPSTIACLLSLMYYLKQGVQQRRRNPTKVDVLVF